MTTAPVADQPASDPFDDARSQFDGIAERLNLEPGMREILRHCFREFTVNFPVRMDDGTVRVFTGYRVHHNQARGPVKGGLRYSANVSPRRSARPRHVDDLEVRRRQPALRRRQGRRHRRSSLALTQRELERLTRRFAAEIGILIGPERDIPAPDMGTDAQIMAWIMDTYSMMRGHSVPAVVTGKPVTIGGSVGRVEATGRGVLYITQQACADRGLDLEGRRRRHPGLRQRRLRRRQTPRRRRRESRRPQRHQRRHLQSTTGLATSTTSSP